MVAILEKILTLVITPILALVGVFTPVEQSSLYLDHLDNRVGVVEEQLVGVESQLLGASGDIPTTIAFFETTLASKISSSATSFTLTSATDKDGNTLASSTYAFIIDEGSSSEEIVFADCTGTACTRVERGISVLTGSSTVAALQKAHRRGSSVKITDAPMIMILGRIVNGQGYFPNVLTYSSSNTFTSNNQIIDKLYADNLAIAGSPDGSLTVKGIYELASALEAASSTPIGGGGTSAGLALTAAIATSTPDTAHRSTQANHVIPVTQSDGYLSPDFISQADSITRTGSTTFNAPVSFASSTIGSITTLTDAATVTIDWRQTNSSYLVLGDNRIIAFNHLNPGSTHRLILCQDNTGSRTVTWPALMRWASGFAPTLTTTGDKCDIISLLTGTSTDAVFGAATLNF